MELDLNNRHRIPWTLSPLFYLSILTRLWMVFKEHFAGDEIKDHAAGGRDDLSDHIVPTELINQEPE